MSRKTTRQGGHPSPRTSPKAAHTPEDTRHLVSQTRETPNTPTQPHPEDVLADRWHQTGHYPIIEIEWLDAISTGDDWVADQNLDTQPAPSLATGYLINDTPDSITIVALINAEWWANGITIPRGCIIQTRTLTP